MANKGRLREFLKEKDIQHWLWDLDGTARAVDWASRELNIHFDDVFEVFMDVAREMHTSNDSEVLKTKSKSAKEFDKIVDDMENNPNSKHRQIYECGCKGTENGCSK